MLRAGEASVSIEIASVNGQEDVGVVDLVHTMQSAHLSPSILARPRQPRG